MKLMTVTLFHFLYPENVAGLAECPLLSYLGQASLLIFDGATERVNTFTSEFISKKSFFFAIF